MSASRSIGALVSACSPSAAVFSARYDSRWKVAVVTGATRGVGRGVATELARQGARVFIADMAAELKPFGVTVVSLYPGLVRTERVMEVAQWLDLSNSESPEFIGRAVVALAADPDVLRHTGQVLIAASVAKDYGFTDIDGKAPRPLTLADV